MNIILLGPPGAGKETQGSLLESELNIPRLSVGNALRLSLDRKEKAGIVAKSFMEKGLNVPPDVLFSVLKLWFLEHRNNFIIDNLPRSQDQLKSFDLFITENAIRLDFVFNIIISEDESVRRLLMRAQEAKRRNVLRIDENEKVIRKRYEVGYIPDSKAINDYFRNKNILTDINGEQSIEKVHADIMHILSP